MLSNLVVKNISKEFAFNEKVLKVIKNITFEVVAGSFITILGPSGCGKTTLLNIIAGFQTPTNGEVLINSGPITRPGKDRVMIFQRDAAFPWLTVEENVRFALKNIYVADDIIQEKIRFFLKLTGLLEFSHYYPKQLSGGMRKRVDIARTFVMNPSFILADEPFAFLDSKTRLSLQLAVMNLWTKEKNTILFVTHDIEEAIFLSDVMYLLSARPSRVLERIEIPFRRPRAVELLTTQKFQSLRKRVMTAYDNN